MQVMIVNGPVAPELAIQADAACFGPGFRANAAIGRAFRLIVRNVAGLTPGEMDKATLSSPGRYSFCFAENEARSPWEPLHVERGYAADSSTVTLAGILGVYRIMESTSGTGFGVLGTIVGNMKTVGIANYYQQATGGQVILVLCPEHATEIAASGLSKDDVKDYVFHNARMPVGQLKGIAHYGNRTWPAWIDESRDDVMVPIVRSARDVVVAGSRRRRAPFLLDGRLGSHPGLHRAGRVLSLGTLGNSGQLPVLPPLFEDSSNHLKDPVERPGTLGFLAGSVSESIQLGFSTAFLISKSLPQPLARL